MHTLAGKHAVVTGGSRGIGLACARALLAAGARVTITGRDEQRLLAAAADLGHTHVHCARLDVADPDSVRAAFAIAADQMGPIAILVNNAGQAESAPFMKTDEELWRRMLDVNLSGVFHCTQAVLPGMLEAEWGRVVNVASTAGLTGYRYVAAYCAAKHGVVGLTRALALELATRGITVNAVCPGYTDTDLAGAAIANIMAKTGRSAEEARSSLAAGNPQQRLVLPDEVAHTVLHLCQDAAAAINGQSIAVAGGEVM